MTDKPIPSAEEAQAAIRKLEQRVRNEATIPGTTSSRAWPAEFAEIARRLYAIIPPDASDDEFKGAMNDIEGQTEKLFRPSYYHGGKDLRKMTTLERHELGNLLAAGKKKK